MDRDAAIPPSPALLSLSWGSQRCRSRTFLWRRASQLLPGGHSEPSGAVMGSLRLQCSNLRLMEQGSARLLALCEHLLQPCNCCLQGTAVTILPLHLSRDSSCRNASSSSRTWCTSLPAVAAVTLSPQGGGPPALQPTPGACPTTFFPCNKGITSAERSSSYKLPPQLAVVL